jgi:hypothetical protein
VCVCRLASFRWDSSDTLMQQDISDFCHMLFDILEVCILMCCQCVANVLLMCC